MSTFQVNSKGNRIKTDILIAGYLRQDIEDSLKMLIPSEIKALCFVYWFIKICDEWDESYTDIRDEQYVEFSGQIVKKLLQIGL